MGVKVQNCIYNCKVNSSWSGFTRSEQLYKDKSAIDFEESAGIDKELPIILKINCMNLFMSNH